MARTGGGLREGGGIRRVAGQHSTAANSASPLMNNAWGFFGPFNA